MSKGLTFSQCTPDQKVILISDLTKTEDIKRVNFNSIVARCMNLLFIGNGSGIAIMFTYYYTRNPEFYKIRCIIFGFIIGVILVFLISTAQYFYSRYDMDIFQIKVKRYFNDKEDWEDIFKLPYGAVWIDRILITLGVISELCFIASSFGALQYFWK